MDLIVDVFSMNDDHLFDDVFVFYLLMMVQMYDDYDSIDLPMIHVENDVLMWFDEISNYLHRMIVVDVFSLLLMMIDDVCQILF
jgi:hypothetical protein